jgi:hypothetical protein
MMLSDVRKLLCFLVITLRLFLSSAFLIKFSISLRLFTSNLLTISAYLSVFLSVLNLFDDCIVDLESFSL